MLHDSQDGEGLEAVQCAPRQLLVVEVCWERNLPHDMGLPRSELAVPRKAQNEAWGMVWAAHASQDWGGKDLGRCRKGQANIAKGFGCFMIPKSGAGRV